MNLPKLTSAMLVVTHACNLRCRYCFVTKDPCHMTFETAKAAAEFLIKNAEEVGDVPSINFFGGEPMIMWDSIIVPLTNWIRNEYKKPFSLGMTSNATLLNEERINFMKENGISLLFSIDGGKETQDYNRPYADGTGSFDTIEPIIEKIAESFIGVTFRMTSIPQTCGNLFNDIIYAESKGFKSFFVVPNVFEKWDDESKSTLKGEITKYGNYYIDCMRKGVEPIGFSTFDKCFKEIKMINAAIRSKSYRNSRACQACGKCGLGSTKFASIHPNGNLYGCQEMTSNEGEESIFYIGNIFTGVEDDRRVALMNMYDAEPIVGDDCANCKYNRICDGGCVANNYLDSENLAHMPDMYCWWKRTLLDETIRVMQILGNEGNEMFKKRW